MILLTQIFQKNYSEFVKAHTWRINQGVRRKGDLTMIISVDTGNKMIKTENLEFDAGVGILDQMPGEREEVILYKENYYRITSRRPSYLEDKTEDERYFILTLFAVAKELERTKGQEERIANGLIEVELLVGLPPAHYGKHRRAFKEYFQQGRIIDYMYMNTPYKITFTEVRVYIQAYAAYCLVAGRQQLSRYPKVLVIDIGGFTVDYMILRFGQLERTYVDSMEEGVIKLYRSVRAGIRQRFGLLLEEADVDDILSGEDVRFEVQVVERVKEITMRYVSELLGIFREIGIDFGTTQTVFAGGGAILLNKTIQEVWKKYQGAYFIINDVRANAKGYRLQYLAEKQEWEESK